MNKCLFGGALFAAGLAAHASAQTFNFESNFGGAYPTSFATAYAYNGGAANDDFVSYDPFNATGSASAAIGGSSAFAQVGSNFLYAESASGDPSGFLNAEGNAYAYFSVSADTDIVIEWDFSGEDGAGGAPFYSDISLVDWTSGGTLVFAIDPSLNPGDPATGTATITLQAGINYALLLQASSSFAGGSSFARATLVPAPGALALVGMGGLVASRRRRA